MPRRARIHFVSLHSSLVNLPISLYGPLLQRSVRPQGLAVHLSLVSSNRKGNVDDPARKSEAYVGWTGMASASSLAQFNSRDAGDVGLETVEIDPQFSEGLGFAMGDVVEIGLLHDLTYAKSISTEPVTSDDWEIIELHASHIESTLLSQVRVATVGQEIDVWVLGRTRVRLQVVSLEPAKSGKALLLTTSTEVNQWVSTRGGPSVNGSKQAITNGSGISKQEKEATDRDPEKKNTRILRVLPTRMLPSIPASISVDPDMTVAYVSRTTLASLLGDPPSAATESSYARIRRIHPPQDPTQEQPSSTSPLVVPRILLPGSASTARPLTPSSLSSNDDVIILWSPDVPVPQGHVVINNNMQGVDDWDLVWVTFIKESSSTPIHRQPSESSVQKRRTTSRPTHGLAGVNEILDRCTKFCLTSFAIHATSQRVRGVPGLLITGRSGAGKTSLLHAVANVLQEDSRIFAYVLYADLTKYSELPIPKIRQFLKYWMDKATWHRPCVLVLDNIEKLMGAELEHADSFRSRHIAELFLSVFGPSSRSVAPNSNGVVLLAGAESQAALHPSLNSAHIFQEVVGLKPPRKDARKDIIEELVLERMDTSDIIQDPAAPLNFTALATQTEGYSVTDLKDFVSRAVHRAAIRSSRNGTDVVETTLLPEDFTAAQVDFIPLSLRNVKLQKSEIAWSDIGGLAETKRVLRETLEWPTKYGPIFAQSPLRLRSGLLLYGYPGCGKTLLASAVAKECGLNFISIKGPELLNKYIGASEKSVRDLFERASAAKPCVLFFDEFDSIAPKRGHDSTGVTDRVVNQMLTQMDGAEGLDGVYVLAATSRPDLIDSALLRPGRLDKSLLCDMPGTEDRKEILVAVRKHIAISPSVDLDALARLTEGFSGADLQALVYNAHLEVIHDTIASSSPEKPSIGSNEKGVGNRAEPDTGTIEYTLLGETESGGKRVVSKAEKSAFQRRVQRIATVCSTSKGPASGAAEPLSNKDEYLHHAFRTMHPSVPLEERERLSQIYHAFILDRSGEMPIPPDGMGVGSRVSLM
ncbi:AAA-domain-containing protein [Amylocystis lapponica]|nr:AAA-domain-containing protein [Amylocystis lapponica]